MSTRSFYVLEVRLRRYFSSYGFMHRHAPESVNVQSSLRPGCTPTASLIPLFYHYRTLGWLRLGYAVTTWLCTSSSKRILLSLERVYLGCSRNMCSHGGSTLPFLFFTFVFFIDGAPSVTCEGRRAKALSLPCFLTAALLPCFFFVSHFDWISGGR